MINYDLHTHTQYSGHAEGTTVEMMLRRADEIGLGCIAITEHISSPADISLIEQIRADASQVKTKCRVVIGAEIDIDGNYSDGRLVTQVPAGLQYVLAGFHFIPGVNKYVHDRSDCLIAEKELFTRWSSTILGAVSNKNINTLAHPARLIAMSLDWHKWFVPTMEVFCKAAQISAANNIAWEINEGDGVYKLPQYVDLLVELYKAVVKEGVKLVYGSDAHGPGLLGNCEYATGILAAVGTESFIGPNDIF